MKPGDPKLPDSTGLEPDLEQVESGYQELEHDEPPAILDQAVLNEARRAVEAHAIRPWSFGWMHATATAALLVVGLTLVLQQRSELPAPPVELNRVVQPKADTAAGPAASENESGMREELQTMETQAIDALESPASPDVGFAEADGQAGEATSARDEALEQPLADERMGQPAAKAAAPVETFRKTHAARAPVADADEEDVAERSENMALSVSELRVDRSNAETMAEPEVWLAAIMEMKEAGDEEAWRRELEAFIVVYPDYPVPEELSEAVRDDGIPDPDGE